MKKIPRIIPCLLYDNGGLVKTKQFKNPVYIGDPINAVKIYNEMEADELIFLDIKPNENKSINFELIQEIANEAFMPVCYGGGIKTMEDISTIINIGIEKVSLNSSIILNQELIKEASDKFGSQSIVVCIDVVKDNKKNYKVFNKNNKNICLFDHIEKVQEAGAGEILIYDVNRDGMMEGYDLKMLEQVSKKSKVPIIACGGAKSLKNMKEAIDIAKIDAVSAGSRFVYFGKLNGILINFPQRSLINKIFNI